MLAMLTRAFHLDGTPLLGEPIVDLYKKYAGMHAAAQNKGGIEGISAVCRLTKTKNQGLPFLSPQD